MPYVPEVLACYVLLLTQLLSSADLAEKVGDRYLRQCESQEYAQELIRHELKRKGVEYVTFAHVRCDPDGSYGAYQVAGGE